MSFGVKLREMLQNRFKFSPMDKLYAVIVVMAKDCPEELLSVLQSVSEKDLEHCRKRLKDD